MDGKPGGEGGGDGLPVDGGGDGLPVDGGFGDGLPGDGGLGDGLPGGVGAGVLAGGVEVGDGVDEEFLLRNNKDFIFVPAMQSVSKFLTRSNTTFPLIWNVPEDTPS